MNANYKTLILAIGLFLALTASVSAAPGDLDLTFGIGGKLTDWSGGANGVAIQADGKIVVVGSSNYPYPWDVAVARYNPDGSPDATFGSAGKVNFTIISGFTHVGAFDVAIQQDGKIVIACDDNDQGFGAVIRLNPDGTRDNSFGTSGVVTTNSLRSVAIQPDGKVVVSGSDVRRFNPNGSPDASLGNCGGIFSAWLPEIAIQPDGKILAAGAGSNGAFHLARCNPNGLPDNTFGTAGAASTQIDSGWHEAHSLAIHPDGKISVAGRIWYGGSYSDLFLLRYNSNGSLDNTFDADGIVSTPINSLPYGNSLVAVQDNGKIVVSGTIHSGSNFDFALLRYNPNGSLDTTFGGGDGVTTVDFNNSNDFAFGMALDSQRRAVVVGASNNGSGYQFALARFLLEPPSTPFDFDGDGRADVSVFRPSDRTWYLNQSTNGLSAVQFGLSTDKITPADYDGDGKTDIAVYRDGTWYWLKSSDNSFNERQFGSASDIPVPADYSGDGRAELAFYRKGTWWMLNLLNDQVTTIQFELALDIPLPADYDGDGRADQAFYRNGEWHLNRSTQGYGVVYWGLAKDKPVPADYDGDGKADLAVYRNGTWFIQQSAQGWAAFNWGIFSDIPAPADYDGDGRADAAVFRNGTWYLRQSTSGFSIQNFGLTNDKLVPAAYLP